MDFKDKKAVDQNALNDAFKVYCVPMRWADKERALVSVDKLIEKISKNPTLLIQFTKAAEENLYSPRADVWIDEVYLRFLNAIVKNKKIPSSRKQHYQAQLTTLQNTLVGNEAPEFKFVDADGKEQTYFPMSTVTMIIFGDPSMTDWRIARLRMETNIDLTQAVDKGKVNIMYIVPKDVENWENEVSNYPKSWIIGKATDAGKIFDLRAVPSIYVIGSDKKILMKNVTPDAAIQEMLNRIDKQ